MKKETDGLLKALKKEGIAKNIVDAFAKVDRMKFFDPRFRDRLAKFEPVPIGFRENSDAPVILAKMIELLSPRKEWRILEIGTGSGYSSAVLSSLVKEIHTVEYHEPIALRAKERVIEAGFWNVRFYAGDASDFGTPLGEFDAVLVLAACLQTPYSIFTMLKNGSTAVYPMGPAHQQQIVKFTNNLRAKDFMKNFSFGSLCAFDSIRGKYGWVDRPPIPPEELEAEVKEEEG